MARRRWSARPAQGQRPPLDDAGRARLARTQRESPPGRVLGPLRLRTPAGSRAECYKQRQRLGYRVSRFLLQCWTCFVLPLEWNSFVTSRSASTGHLRGSRWQPRERPACSISLDTVNFMNFTPGSRRKTARIAAISSRAWTTDGQAIRRSMVGVAPRRTSPCPDLARRDPATPDPVTQGPCQTLSA